MISTTHLFFLEKPIRAVKNVLVNCLEPNNHSSRVTNGVGPHVCQSFTAVSRASFFSLEYQDKLPLCGILLLIGWIIGATNAWRLLRIDLRISRSSRYSSKSLRHTVNFWIDKVLDTYRSSEYRVGKKIHSSRYVDPFFLLFIVATLGP